VFKVKTALSSLVVLAAVLGASCGVSEQEAGAPQTQVSAMEAEAERKKCDYNDPTRRYVSRDPAECQLIFFTCNPGETTFFNDCGCGCIVAQ
jgi:hypothetical protein